jgi:hypothetical protein
MVNVNTNIDCAQKWCEVHPGKGKRMVRHTKTTLRRKMEKGLSSHKTTPRRKRDRKRENGLSSNKTTPHVDHKMIRPPRY